MATLSSYDELLLKVKPRPIQSDSDYRRLLKEVDELMRGDSSREANLMIDLLASLIEKYEAEHYPIERTLSPAQLMAELMEARQVSHAELCSATGISKSVLSNVLAGRRGISKSNAVRLAEYFRLPVANFLEHTKPTR